MKQLIISTLVLFSFCKNSKCQGFDTRWIDQVETDSRSFTRKINSRALVVGIFENGQDSLLTFGRINLLGRKPDGEDVFQIGSVSKTFTGYLLAKAIVDDGIDVHSPVSDFLQIKGKEKYGNTSLLSLSTHTSGLPNNTITLLTPTFISYVGAIIAFNQFVLTPLEVSQWIIDVPWKIAFIPPPIPFFSMYGKKSVNFDLNLYNPNQKKQSEFHYSNLGMGLLGQILAERKGLTYEELLKSDLTEKFGLNNTGISLAKKQKRNFATPHNILGIRTLRTKFKQGGIEGAGGIRSTGNDMLKYLRLQLEGVDSSDSLIFKTLQKSYFVSENPKQTGLEMGIGWIKYNPPGDSDHTIIWHNGQIAGSSAFIGFIPDQKIGIFILSNNGRAKKITKLGFKLLREYK
ncbi:MAG: serine hydrolase domain-containing protein [Reichenbachiella sp.]|uniref:serine hydrolase domain-containing protein n=1 Tax=Reichenbachiella sp. TaxID=2184521 RepID=UPI0032983705